MKRRADVSLDDLQARAVTCLPLLFGLQMVRLDDAELVMKMAIQPQFLAPNGFLHAASVIALADTACGFATIAHMPQGAENFTTIELKSNFLGTAREGVLHAVARGVHIGRTTQVWDASVLDAGSGKTIALFRCTQMILWPKASTT
jgi:1,4-dihydroxy-2-naphthoyl-CoA hydrolase